MSVGKPWDMALKSMRRRTCIREGIWYQGQTARNKRRKAVYDGTPTYRSEGRQVDQMEPSPSPAKNVRIKAGPLSVPQKGRKSTLEKKMGRSQSSKNFPNAFVIGVWLVLGE